MVGHCSDKAETVGQYHPGLHTIKKKKILIFICIEFNLEINKMKITKTQLREIIREELLNEGKATTKPKNIIELLALISRWKNDAKVIDSNLTYDTDAGGGWMSEFESDFNKLEQHLKKVKGGLPYK